MLEEDKKAIEWFREDLEEEKEKCGKYNDYKKQVIKRNEKILNLIKSQQEEIEKKDKIIDLILQDLMVCGGLDFIDIGKSNGNFKEDKQKLKQYFEKKVEDN